MMYELIMEEFSNGEIVDKMRAKIEDSVTAILKYMQANKARTSQEMETEEGAPTTKGQVGTATVFYCTYKHQVERRLQR